MRSKMRTQPQIVTIQDEILDLMTQGYSLNSICQEHITMSSAEVYRMLNKYADFREKYVCARAQQALFYAEKMQKTIDDLPAKPTREEIDKAKLSIDTDKFICAKMLPKIYGPLVAQTNIQINTQPITGMQIVDIDHEEVE